MDRTDAMVQLYRGGLSGHEIGARYGISGARVYQILGRAGVKRTERFDVKGALLKRDLPMLIEGVKTSELRELVADKPYSIVHARAALRAAGITRQRGPHALLPHVSEIVTLRQEGLSLSTIAKRVGMSVGSVCYHLRKNNMVGKQVARNPEVLSAMKYAYMNTDVACSDIAKVFGISIQGLDAMRKRLDWPMRRPR